MKKYLKVGLGVVIPVALVLQIGLWLISITQGFFESLCPCYGRIDYCAWLCCGSQQTYTRYS